MKEAIKIIQAIYDQAYKIHKTNPTDYGEGLTDGLFSALSILREAQQEK